MPLWAAFIAGAGLAVTLVTLLLKSGMWFGHQDVTVMELRQLRLEMDRLNDWKALIASGVLLEKVTTLEQRLREVIDWKHRVGEDPSKTLLELYRLMMEDFKRVEGDIARLEARVFDGPGHK